MANYPASQPALSNPAGTDLVSTGHAALHGAENDEIEAIALELGTDPAGLYAATVRERFEISAYKMQSCRFATVSALPAVTYANGTAGVGATLTATANGVMAAVDGITPAVNDRMMVKNQAAPLQNGLYTVTSVGAVGAPFVLTRAIDADTALKLADMKVLVDSGTVNADTEWYCSATAPTVGTTAIYFRRSTPIYGHGNPRSLWTPGYVFPTGAQSVMETIPRFMALSSYTASGNQHLMGGLVLPAGRTVTNVNLIYITAGATFTVRHYALVRQSDRLVLAHTANSTTAPGIVPNITTVAFTTPLVPIEDTPVWLMLSHAATTLPSLMSAQAGSNLPAMLVSPAISAHNGVVGSATVPTDGTTVITAPTTGLGNIAYVWLT